VRTIADGRVIRAIYNPGGYGNMVEVRHNNGFVSRYAHLRSFARGVRSGSQVRQGETVGYVGMTGLATAPHLHFELLVGGRPSNPMTALRSAEGTPLPAGERSAFDQLRQVLTSLLNRDGQIVRLADAP
jgi:murein DD-endopeptidase MepM/ murein hydrolase activator NlpD